MKLPKLFKRKTKNPQIIEFEQVLHEKYVPIEQHRALEQRVQVIETSLSTKKEERLDFPSRILELLHPEIRKTVEGIMFNYEHDFPVFCFMGMRKALIDAIRIRFMKDRKEHLLYDTDGNAYKLPTWIDLARQQRYISRSMAKNLNDKVKVFGDEASHDFMVGLQKEEVPAIFVTLRMALARMYYEDQKRN